MHAHHAPARASRRPLRAVAVASAVLAGTMSIASPAPAAPGPTVTVYGAEGLPSATQTLSRHPLSVVNMSAMALTGRDADTFFGADMTSDGKLFISTMPYTNRNSGAWSDADLLSGQHVGVFDTAAGTFTYHPSPAGAGPSDISDACVFKGSNVEGFVAVSASPSGGNATTTRPSFWSQKKNLANNSVYTKTSQQLGAVNPTLFPQIAGPPAYWYSGLNECDAVGSTTEVIATQYFPPPGGGSSGGLVAFDRDGTMRASLRIPTYTDNGNTVSLFAREVKVAPSSTSKYRFVVLYDAAVAGTTFSPMQIFEYQRVDKSHPQASITAVSGVLIPGTDPTSGGRYRFGQAEWGTDGTLFVDVDAPASLQSLGIAAYPSSYAWPTPAASCCLTTPPTYVAGSNWRVKWLGVLNPPQPFRSISFVDAGAAGTYLVVVTLNGWLRVIKWSGTGAPVSYCDVSQYGAIPGYQASVRQAGVRQSGSAFVHYLPLQGFVSMADTPTAPPPAIPAGGYPQQVIATDLVATWSPDQVRANENAVYDNATGTCHA